jgi:hypothetical protein
MTAKRNFPLSADVPAEGNPESRSATALEFIAYYLDRIEGHLERLANVAETQTSQTGMTRNGMAAIRAAIS